IRIFRDEAPPGAKLAIGIISWSLIGGDGYGVMQRGGVAAASLRLQNSSSFHGDGGSITTAGSTNTNGKLFNGKLFNGNGGEAGRGEGGGEEEPGSACSTERLETLLERYQPQALWFFAPATPCKEAYTICQARGVDIIAQVGTVGEARAAVEMGASVVVAQGREAGGHGLRPDVARGTLPLAAAVAVELAETGKPVLAAGGVVSGRGLLAALALGCDGVVMGTRYCATYEALGSDNDKAKLVSTSELYRTVLCRVIPYTVTPSNPVVWPVPYDSCGVAANTFTKKWNTREEDLAVQLLKRWGV
ncbi:unnamed protein product, partial [Laminaria digitata]